MSDPSTPHSLGQELHAAMEWWRLAGVDNDFSDDATDWLNDARDQSARLSGVEGKQEQQNQRSRAARQDPTPQPPKPERLNLFGANPPQTLTEFQEWWLTAPGLDAIGPRGRVAPHGPQNPELMVLVVDPEQSDKDTLLSGPQGRLLSRIIAAMGLSEESVYFASALPRNTPMADTVAIAASGMDEITQFHVNLVSPRQVLAFGAGIPPLLGHALTNDLSLLHEINQSNAPVPLIVTEGLDAMMAMPRLKARFWRRWIEWSANG